MRNATLVDGWKSRPSLYVERGRRALIVHRPEMRAVVCSESTGDAWVWRKVRKLGVLDENFSAVAEGEDAEPGEDHG